ncbi:hypothetical protein [Salinibacterium sp.]|nr:hypothetical protein [Salinibacterium sp.]
MKLPPWVTDWHIWAASVVALVTLAVIFRLLVAAFMPDAHL